MGPIRATNERRACGVQHPNLLADIFVRRQTGGISNLDMDGRVEEIVPQLPKHAHNVWKIDQNTFGLTQKNLRILESTLEFHQETPAVALLQAM